MATNEIDTPLYTESKLTRKQAIDEIADVILRSNMKPRMVEFALELLQKLLPVNNTLPTTMNELFGAMMSTENDWRLAQYLIKHKQNPSFLLSPTNTSDEDSPRFFTVNSNDSSSSSDDENELNPYDRLQQCLQPIMGVSTEYMVDMNLNYARSEAPSSLMQTLKRMMSDTSSIASPDEDDSEDENNKFCCFEVNGHNLLNDSKRRRYN